MFSPKGIVANLAKMANQNSPLPSRDAKNAILDCLHSSYHQTDLPGVRPCVRVLRGKRALATRITSVLVAGEPMRTLEKAQF